ncbi:hypothetical protein B0T17DRAFT_525310 [Bombardia bombarda]|uniref:Uncharacterized protein n=1 Tax=Bombardia bombarda TaxID=252184 RepID=A0AA40C8E7_9PEZI|nr:hypothetical protein B0T17DRAFT_525310 [Bombardia bombarda]
MRSSLTATLCLVPLLSPLAICATTTTTTTPGSPPLNMTAISSRDGYSVLECWQLASVPVDAMSAANYALGANTTTATWSRIEPRTFVGEAWAPHVQITSPAPSSSSSTNEVANESSTASSAQLGGAGAEQLTELSSVLIAADLKAVSTIQGHLTEFPSDEPTVLVQIPFEGDKIPEHVVLYDGPCV